MRREVKQREDLPCRAVGRFLFVGRVRDWLGAARRLLPFFWPPAIRVATLASFLGLTAGGIIAFNLDHPVIGSALGFAGLIILTFAVGVSRQREVERLEQELGESKGQYESLQNQERDSRSIRAQLAKFIELGEIVEYRIRQDAESDSPNEGADLLSPPLWLHRAQDWAEEVELWLGRFMGYDYKKQFEIPVGISITRRNPIPMKKNTNRHRRIWEGTEVRMMRLNQFIEEVRSGGWSPPPDWPS